MRRRVLDSSRVRGRSRSAPVRMLHLAVLVVAALALPGCGPDPYDGTDGAPPPTRPATRPSRHIAHVQARDNSLQERDITVAAGTEVVWTNVGRNDHDVIPTEFEDDPTAAPWGIGRERFRPTAAYSHVFDRPGTYAYVCTIHGVGDKGMAGTVTVTP